MPRITAAVGGVLAASVAIVGFSVDTAQAATPIVHHLGTLHLTKESATGIISQARLTCDSVQYRSGPAIIRGRGTVKNPQAACEEIEKADGDLSTMDVHPTWLTTALYLPVVASAHGWWAAHELSWNRTFANDSALTKFTGDVFGF